jgi:transcriptional regulator with XRE-family HTH domain
MARRRRFSDEPFGQTVERLMAETGYTYRSLADKTKLSAGYLNHLVHGNRPVPGDDVIRTLASALGVEPGLVTVRATTTDRLGFTGRGEGLAATAVALLRSA